MNLSASILRELVGSVFKLSPHKVILSGEIEPTKTWNYTTGVSYVKHWEEIRIWGFNPENGFEQITDKVCNVTSYYNSNHDYDYTSATHNLAEASFEKNYIFYVVIKDGADYSGDEYSNCTLYKAPDFQTYWDKINSQDIERWQSWLIKII